MMCCRVSVLEFIFVIALALCTVHGIGDASSCPDGSEPVECVADPCLTASCTAFPKAVCTANYCGGCNAVFSVDESVVKCDVAPGKGSCPDGSDPVNCLVDPCTTATCPAYPKATCTADYCGGCNTKFSLDGETVNCSQATGKCPDGSDPVNCLVDPCMTATCPAYPKATCTADYCGGCNAKFSVDGKSVDCSQGTGKCPDGSNPVNCLIDPCRVATCPAYPKATCTADYCGGCNTKFSLDGKAVNCSATCSYNGIEFADGDSYKLDCNTCICMGGVAACTKMACITSPCAAVTCMVGYTCVAQADGLATCIPIDGKPGVCPKLTTEIGGGTCVQLCTGDASCNGTQKCCKGSCGSQCAYPVTPTTTKPGTCPAAAADENLSICSVECAYDSDCVGANKCCYSGCSSKCSRPKENPCTKCDPLIVPAVLPRVCPDGSTEKYECNLATCQWDFKPCPLCSCDLSAVKPIACPTASKENTCGKAVCTSVDGACVGSWSCDDCEVSVPVEQKCITAGCQSEKCVAIGDRVTLECALWSTSTACLKYSSCAYNASSETCAWLHTDAYGKCMQNPEEPAPCQSRYPCECLSNPECGWCSTFDTLANGITVSWGQCMPASIRSKCLSPRAEMGLAGTFLPSTACTIRKQPQALLDQINSQISESSVQESISAELDADVDVAGKFNVLLQTILEAAPSESDAKIAYLRNFIKIVGALEPTEDELEKLCKLISSGFGRKLGLSANDFSDCKLTKVQDNSSASSKRAMLQSSSSGTYLHEVAFGSESSPSAALTPFSALAIALVAYGCILAFA